ncbi:MAG: hypothetical protein O7G87_12865 [bacterium]|nr:hypothetical protein [bacterium]
MSQTAYQNLIRRLQKLQKEETTFRCLFGLALTLAAGTGVVFFLLLFEATFYLKPITKLTLETLIGLGLIVLFVRFVLYPFLSPSSLEILALRIEGRFQVLHQRLIGALQLWDQRTRPGMSTALIEASVQQAETVSKELDFKTLIDRKRPRNMAVLLSALFLVATSVFLLWPDPIKGAAHRLAHPQTAFVRPPDTYITLHPGNAEVIAGTPFEIEAKLSGVVPLSARLLVRESGISVWTPLDVPIRHNKLTHLFPAVTRSFDYRVQAHDAQTETYTLIVRPRPMVTRMVHDAHFPAYTKLAPRPNQSGGDIVAPPGTSIDLQIESSIPIEKAWLQLDESPRLPARVDGRTARVEFTVTKDQRYTVGLLDPHQISNKDPVIYRIIALEDRPPEVRLLRPGRDSELGESMQVALLADAHDDYGVAQMQVRYQITDDPQEYVVPIPLTTIAKEQTKNYTWDLSALPLLPGDQVTYRVRAYDNNTISGPGFGETAAFTLRFPSLFEIHHEAEKTQAESLEYMEVMQKMGAELQERLEKIARELLKNEDLNWQEKKEAESLLQDQEHISEKLQETAERLEKALDRLEKSGLLGAETLQKLEEIQKLLSSIQTPELAEAMEELRKALQNVDPKAVQEALQNFQIEQESFQKNLDRTISLLKRVRDQQTLDALTERLKTLAQEQEQVVQSLEGGVPPQDLAQREERLARQTQQLQEEMQQAAEEISEAQKTGDQLNDLADALTKQQIQPRMNQTAQNLQAGQKQIAGKEGKKLAQELQQMADQLQGIRDDFLQTQKAEVARQLNRILHDLLTLSRTQEHTTRQAEQARGEAQTAPLALEQARNLAAVHRLAKRVLESAQKTFFVPPTTGATLGRAIKNMQDAAGQLQNRNGQGAARKAREAMGNLNTTALLVRQALASLSEAGSSTGFEEMLAQMQQMAQQQGNLNAQTQSLFGQQQRPGGQSPGGFDQLAAEQMALQKALDALRQQLARQQQQMLGELGGIASDMEQTAKDLQRKAVNRQTLNRQRQILSRLLDAQRSIRSRGKSRQREAKIGATFAYQGPGSLPAGLGEVDNPLRKRLAEALKAGYSAEYQTLIRKYFESLIQDAGTRQDN